MFRADAGVIETGADAVCLFDLAFFVLEQEGAEERCARLASDAERLVTEFQRSREKRVETMNQVVVVEEEIGRQTSLMVRLSQANGTSLVCSPTPVTNGH